MTAVLLALVTALCYGLANYAGALMTRAHPLGGVLLVGQTVGVVGAGALLAASGGALPADQPLVLGALAGVCNAVSLACLYAAAAAGPISIVAPIGATGAVVPVAVALLAGERPALVQLLGIPLAVGGVVLAAARESGGTAHAAPRTLLLAAGSALTFGGFLALFGAASDASAPWALFSSRATLVACTAAVVLGRGLPVAVPRGGSRRSRCPACCCWSAPCRTASPPRRGWSASSRCSPRSLPSSPSGWRSSCSASGWPAASRSASSPRCSAWCCSPRAERRPPIMVEGAGVRAVPPGSACTRTALQSHACSRACPSTAPRGEPP